MNCKNCNAEISTESRFCGKCGTESTIDEPLSPEQANETQEEIPVESIPEIQDQDEPIQKSKISKKILFAVIAFICLACVATVLIFININDPAADVITALEHGNYAEALFLAEEVDIEALQRRLESRLETLEADFRAETIEFSIVIMELDTIEAMRIPALFDILNTTSNNITNLNASRTAFNTAEVMFYRGDYITAIVHYRRVIYDDTNYPYALEGVHNATNAYRNRILERVSEYVSVSNYQGAIRILNTALWELGDDSELMQNLALNEQRFTTVRRSSILEEASLYTTLGLYEDAIQVLESGLRELENDSELIQALELNTQNFVDAVISIAHYAVSLRDYDDAIFTLNRALQTLSGNSQLIRARDEIEAIRPVNLLSLTPVTSSAWRPYLSLRSINLVFEPSGWPGIAATASRAEFFVNSRYSTLRGRITADEHLNPDTRMRFRVFADDTLVYESDYISRASEFEFEANIIGAEFIRINVSSSVNRTGRFTASDLILER